MSLINDALKKAQHQRAHEGDAALAAGSPAGKPTDAQARRARNGLMLAAVAALLVIAAGVVGILVLKTGSSLSAPPTAAAASPAPAKAAPVPVPVVKPPAPPAAKPANETALKETQSPLVSLAIQALRPEAGAKDTPAKVAKPAPAPAPEPKPDVRIPEFLSTLKIAGVRSSGSGSKVLMNDHVFRVNDVVEPSLGLTLTGVSADTLTFTDASGKTYTKRF